MPGRPKRHEHAGLNLQACSCQHKEPIMIGPWRFHETGLQSYMRRRIFGLFWLYRLATDAEVRNRFSHAISN